MKLETYRRKEQGFYSALQNFLDEVGEEAAAEVPNIHDIMSSETAQIERLTVMATRKIRFEDQHNHQSLSASLRHDVPVTLGVKEILGQPQRVYLNKTGGSLNPRMFDWNPVGTQQILVVVHFLVDPGEPVECTFDVWGE